MKMNQRIEHTILKPDTMESDIKKLCEEAIEHGFFGVCVPPYFVKHASILLKDSSVKIVTVAGFPLGYNTTPAKVEEARKAMDEGAHEIDMVMNIAALKNNDLNFVQNDIQSVATLVQLKGCKLKVIIETALLSNDEKVKACEICAKVGVDFVKTSTGFASSGAKLKDIELMRKNLPANIKIKASGGIKTKEQAKDLVKAGADRLGTSSGPDLIE
ncbi:deoxyribose-phosphate aldolase [Chitinophagales bacterium]|jgi:deoxyribose-phosphate aldolase|nr:deoxyribose-phosphate aldolase [Chitinophagales bacterium]